MNRRKGEAVEEAVYRLILTGAVVTAIAALIFIIEVLRYRLNQFGYIDLALVALVVVLLIIASNLEH